MCTMYMPGGCRGQERVSDYSELEYRSLLSQLCILNQNANEESCLTESENTFQTWPCICSFSVWAREITMVTAHCIYIPISYTSYVFVHITMPRNNLHKEIPFKGRELRIEITVEWSCSSKFRGLSWKGGTKLRLSSQSCLGFPTLWLLGSEHQYSKYRCVPVLRSSSHC